MGEHTPLYKAELDESAMELYVTLYIGDEPYADVYIGDQDQNDIGIWREIANLWIAAPELLAACQADEAFHQHYHSCDECDEIWCEVMSALYQEAKDLRQAAIAKAKGE